MRSGSFRWSTEKAQTWYRGGDQMMSDECVMRRRRCYKKQIIYYWTHGELVATIGVDASIIIWALGFW